MKGFLAPVLIGCAAAGTFGAGIIAGARPAHAVPVFDSANYAQNLVIAARALEQVNQQIQSLQNEAAMLAHMARNLKTVDFPQLEQLRQDLERIDALMDEASGIAFGVEALDERFRELFPMADPAKPSEERLQTARARLEAALAQHRHAMAVQSRIVENVRADAEALSEIVATSQGAGGALQAQQAGNQLLALAAKQQLQIQQLMAAQFRADVIEQARRAQSEREGRAATRRFLGDGRAYSPR